MGSENRNNTSCYRYFRAHQEGTTKHTEKIPGAINIIELKKITIRNSPHTKKVLSKRQNLSALGPWFGPGPSGVYIRSNSKNSHNNNNEPTQSSAI